MSIVRGAPTSFPIENRHYLSNRKRVRFGILIQSETIGDSTLAQNSSIHLKFLLRKDSTKIISIINNLLKSYCNRISMCFGSKWSNEKEPFNPNLLKKTQDLSMVGGPCKNFPISAKWKGFDSDSPLIRGSSGLVLHDGSMAKLGLVEKERLDLSL